MENRSRWKFHTAYLLVVLIGLNFVTGSVGAGSGRPKNVQVSLRAKWSGTPLLLEAGELLSKESESLLWEFIQIWLNTDGDSECLTAKCCFLKIVQHGRSILSKHLGALFEHSLALRSASSRLVLYRQLARDSLSRASLSPKWAAHGMESSPENGSGSVLVENMLNGINPSGPGGKCCWIDVGNSLLFNVSELVAWSEGLAQISHASLEQLEIFDFDHVYHGGNFARSIAVLYGALGTDCFREFHPFLAEAAMKGKIRYVLRPVLPSGCEAKTTLCGALGTSDALNLGGYGVELALKNMEYKAMDDNTIKKGVILEDPQTEDLAQEVRGFIFSKLLERQPELTSEIMAFRDYLLSSTISDTLEVWELKDLGHQTAQRIVHASDPFQSMQEINQNFPSIVSSLSRMKLNSSIKDEIISNQRMVPPGKSLMALNGALIDTEEIDLYMLLDLVHAELSLADQFSKLKIPPSAIRKLLSAQPSSETNSFRVDFRSTHVHYLNNLEEDAMYRRWRSNINEILMPVFPGQLRYIRKNLFTTVFVLDPAMPCGSEAMDAILSMYRDSVPMRFGVILYSSNLIKHIEDNGGDLPVSSARNVVNDAGEDISIMIIRFFLYIKRTYDAQSAFQFLSKVNRLQSDSVDSAEEVLEMHHLEAAFVETLQSKVKSSPQETLLKLEKDLNFKVEAEESSKFVFKLGLSRLKCCLLMNGLVFDATEDSATSAMNEELPRLQEQVYYGHIGSDTDILEKFLSESGSRRYNPLITVEGENSRRFVSLFSSSIGKDSILHDMNYLHSAGTVDNLKAVTHLIVTNISTKKGINLLHEGIRYLMRGSKRSRVGVLFNVKHDASRHALLFAEVFRITITSFSHKEKVLDFLDQLCSFYGSIHSLQGPMNSDSLQSFNEKVYELAFTNGLPSEEYKNAVSGLPLDSLLSHLEKVHNFLHWQVKLGFGDDAVITNGRVILPTNDDTFLSDDLDLLESVEFEKRTKYIVDIIEQVELADVDPDNLTSNLLSDLIMFVTSSLSVHKKSSDRARFEILNAKYSAVVLENEDSSIHIDAVIDPLSPSGQKVAPILHILWKSIQPSMRIVLNPMSSLADIPLKNYYRFVVPTLDDFSSVDNSVIGPKAFFSNMPLAKTLTMNLDVPEPWLVESKIAVHDLDNILLENLGDERTLQAVFELEALILTGHCSEKDHDPPRGLQLILGTRNMPHLVDTIVMANLGYWQMKVSPGVWYLQLAPGRSTELYNLNEKGEISQQNSRPKLITIDDLRGKLVHLEAVKRRGKEHEELLTASADDSHLDEGEKESITWNTNLLKWASGIISSHGKPTKKQQLQTYVENRRHGKTINIFSIASGHLYERFTKIMILGVLKNTQRPVKFWFIKNYLSPQFKDVIPHMAQEYGFEYELITYKWPSWLHKQKEKQRIIWAYKILFLDVIFPLSLEKVIFVDADQVVRADMGELYDMNIKGRPLAYTPFCDNNKDMDGYRFWRQGFWKDHLRGKPYHISALYVVDLVKFRQTAAGDTLRIFYETLSKDPNSLSNLDQDLPNYAQHTVPIFSLPQEWLWCESWCGNATKSKAKTIDLCNNPMTKEPKLQGARRIIPEWNDLDAEARAVTARILGTEPGTQDVAPTSPPMTDTAPPDNNLVEDMESRSEL